MYNFPELFIMTGCLVNMAIFNHITINNGVHLVEV